MTWRANNASLILHCLLPTPTFTRWCSVDIIPTHTHVSSFSSLFSIFRVHTPRCGGILWLHTYVSMSPMAFPSVWGSRVGRLRSTTYGQVWCSLAKVVSSPLEVSRDAPPRATTVVCPLSSVSISYLLPLLLVGGICSISSFLSHH